MQTEVTFRSHKTLFFNALAFTVCFAAWMLNGVLVTFLVDNQIFSWGPVEIGWLMGIPVLTGSIFRLPAGMLTDKFGGKPVYGLLLVLCAIPMYLLSQANSFYSFALCSFGFGLTGVSFAIGIAFTSVWYPKRWQGTALGIFGAGNAGAALTTLLAPTLLKLLTNEGTYLEGWRMLPKIYAAGLLGMGIVFLLFTNNKKTAHKRTFREMLHPLKSIRVWRFGFYYFLVFGMFVAFSQWLVPYFVNVYSLSLVTAGMFASLFSFPSGVIRAVGGWMSDHWGARRIMYWVLGSSVLICLMMSVPKMEIFSPGKGIMAKRNGKVSLVSPQLIRVGNQDYSLKSKSNGLRISEDKILIFPVKDSWQEPVVKAGETVVKKQLLAKGVTHIYFQANVWIFAVLALLIGSIWGIGKAAVYKHIPDYFPEEVGVVGGMVGLLGGLGGFFGPVIFGYLLQGTGLWSTCWMFLFLVSLACILWMHRVVKKMSILPSGFEKSSK
ncbi:MAG: MFS transporter [Deltaproteobacteria bacterium RIFCSPLOWO2_02_FULL_50_16]|nr:MAG: MFS transporter [Deltaproteobacteria bacterium GWA2_50_8]OGQ26346.1 MAG: MFS transporter [Deltaproteobacteria bacterium RIFCSPHIGHO2_02_FULL_50_15]OGQ56672.1 MAG: MFS transporter [Deltaproteobacteria bacterium RIFCSPLOWO2_02_FULL_50_16]OGQ65692.1 MAG: MFS transporter [Deltaproteobacteria bacterium RIFCSPLOWO2_12_FULL_50_11]